MKILLINDHGAPIGGAELMLLRLRQELNTLGHDVRLFSTTAETERENVVADYTCFGTSSSFRTLLQTANPFACSGLKAVLHEFNPDVVHVRIFLTQLSPLIMPLLRDYPTVYHAAWYRSICPTGTKTLPNGKACEFPAGLACLSNKCLPVWDWVPLMFQLDCYSRWKFVFDACVTPSEALKNSLQEDFINPIKVIWNAVPVTAPRPLLVSPPVVAYAGRMVQVKGVDILVRAFKKALERVPNAVLVLAGDGPDLSRIKALIADLGLAQNVKVLGHLSQTELESQLQSAWVQVVPSRWSEPFGIAAAESMMRGTCVVASNTGGLAEFIESGKTGFLVPPGDVDALAEALIRCLSEVELVESMGRAAREFALQNLDLPSFARKFLMIYDSVIGNPVN